MAKKLPSIAAPKKIYHRPVKTRHYIIGKPAPKSSEKRKAGPKRWLEGPPFVISGGRCTGVKTSVWKKAKTLITETEEN